MASDGERLLGVTEAIVAVRDQCPSGAVRQVARGALETVGREGAETLPAQAYLVLSATRGWTGERAALVRRSLEAFLAGGSASDPRSSSGS